MFIELFRSRFAHQISCPALDLGCGTGDITIRFARAYPHCPVHAVDGAEAMLRHARAAVRSSGLEAQILLINGRIPEVTFPESSYGVIFSNSLLHHLPDPMVLWQTVRDHAREGTAIFIMDLFRPDSTEDAVSLVERYSGDEPGVLKRDFYNSLLAAFTLEEVEEQLVSSGFDFLDISKVSDRHLVVSGQI